MATAVRPQVLAASLDAAGAVIASAWGDASFQKEKEELATAAREVLLDSSAPSEAHVKSHSSCFQARASAHSFYARVALATFEDFAGTVEVAANSDLEEV